MANQIELCDLSYSFIFNIVSLIESYDARHVAIHTYINQMMMIQLFWWSIIISTYYCYGFEPWNSLIVGERYTSSWYFMNGKKKAHNQNCDGKIKCSLAIFNYRFLLCNIKAGKNNKRPQFMTNKFVSRDWLRFERKHWNRKCLRFVRSLQFAVCSFAGDPNKIPSW